MSHVQNKLLSREAFTDIKHGVGILLNKKWNQRNTDSEYIIKLTTDHPIKSSKRSGSTRQIAKDVNLFLEEKQNWDLFTEANASVLADTHSTKETKEMTVQKHLRNKNILTKRRYLGYNKDAKANDMIHMGSDHVCHGNFHDLQDWKE